MQINNGIYVGRPNVSAIPPAPNMSLKVDANPDFNIVPYTGTSDGNFTIEWFQKMSSDDNHPRAWSFGSWPGAAHAVSIENGNFYYWINASIITSINISGYLNNWATFCVMRKSGFIFFFLNGSLIGDPLDFSDAITVTGLPLYIGSEGNDSLFNGLMSNFRFVNGNAVYGIEGYTPASSPLSSVFGTKLLLMQGNSLPLELIDNSGMGNVITNGTGSYNIGNPFTGYQGSLQFGTV